MKTPSSASKTTTEGSAAFVPIPRITDNLDDFAVGHAGAYPIDKDDAVSAEPITKCIPLYDKAGKVLIDCEKGIKNFVKDVLASKLTETAFEVSKSGASRERGLLSEYGLTPDDVKHLPNSETGVWIYYLTKGIERDYGITWVDTPISQRKRASNQSKPEKARKQGKRGLSKQEKNIIMEHQDMKYWRPLIENGTISKEQAYEEIDKAYATQQEWEKEGFFFSPKKTEGMLLFDYKAEVMKSNGRENGYKIYSRNDLSVVLPNVIDNYFLDEDGKSNKMLMKEVDKTWLKGSSPQSIDDLLKDDWGTMETSKKELLQTKINGLHIVKIMKSGFMKDRWLCFDCTDKKTGKLVLHLFCGAQHMTMHENDLLDK
jgi:hypothetical protein